MYLVLKYFDIIGPCNFISCYIERNTKAKIPYMRYVVCLCESEWGMTFFAPNLRQDIKVLASLYGTRIRVHTNQLMDPSTCHIRIQTYGSTTVCLHIAQFLSHSHTAYYSIFHLKWCTNYAHSSDLLNWNFIDIILNCIKLCFTYPSKKGDVM